jgi:hypothetical protein
MHWKLAVGAAVLIALFGVQSAPSAADLNYEVFKTKVQPIFLAQRGNHARCVTCHSTGTPFRLQPLAPGASSWNEEESQKNFTAVKRVAKPGDMKSMLLVHPLLQSAGGDFFHNGGKHWRSQSDPEWQALKAWVMGESTSAGK